VSELVYTTDDPPDAVVAYLGSQYPDIKNIEGNVELIRAQGYDIVSHFTLPESAWRKDYYDPMKPEIARLREKYRGNETARSILDMFAEEIAFNHRYAKQYGYEFFVLKKTD
jgi:hypothetical protein